MPVASEYCGFLCVLTTTIHAPTQVKTEAQADEILTRLEGGADFGEVAMVESDCPSKQQGGDLGWFGPGQMVRMYLSDVYIQ